MAVLKKSTLKKGFQNGTYDIKVRQVHGIFGKAFTSWYRTIKYPFGYPAHMAYNDDDDDKNNKK